VENNKNSKQEYALIWYYINNKDVISNILEYLKQG